MLRVDWRAPGAYGHAKAIPPAGFAWEYLRRHEDYHRDFQTISHMKEPTASELDAFSQRWGLRFPVRPRNPT
ncbi:transcriptional regulator domain-containing protein [Pseudomonas aeruginosa]|uniref:transcriptional regulator domain-containing protein n=1 Tax=Thermomonas sp. TaxID=1971895 RepID=UPI0039E4D885